MKIKNLVDETLIRKENDLSQSLCRKFGSCNSRESLKATLEEGIAFNFIEPVNLSMWIDLLNLLDNSLETMNASEAQSQEETTLLSLMLDFTSHLLFNSYNKDLYNSLENLLPILKGSNVPMSEKVINVLYSLSLPPLNYRHDTVSHQSYTQLSKTPGYFPVLQELLSLTILPISYKEILTEHGPSNILLDSKTCTSDAIQETARHSWKAKIDELVTSFPGRCSLIVVQLKLILIMASSHPDKTALFEFFKDKLALVKDLVWLVGELPKFVSSNSLLLKLSNLAVQCISATFEDHHHSATPLFVNFPWMLHDLGLTRGQYAGLVPQVLQFSVGYFTERLSGHAEEINDFYWMENVLLLINNLTTISSSIGALIDAGVILSLLSMIKIKNRSVYNSNAAFVVSLCIELVDLLLSNHANAILSFNEANGMEIIVSRLHEEVALAATQGSSPAGKLILQNLLLLMVTYLQESGMDSSRDIPLHRDSKFLSALQIIVDHPSSFSGAFLTSLLSILSDIINRDPAPPTILNGLLNTSILIGALKILPKVEDLDNDLPVAVISLASAVALVHDGQKLIEKSNVFQDIFALFQILKNYYPHSKALMLELPTNIGSSLEHFSRHYPSFVKKIVQPLFEVLRNELLSLNITMTTSYNPSAGWSFDSHFEQRINVIVALSSCLEQLLEKQTVVEEFLSNGLISILVEMKRVSLGPSKFCLLSGVMNAPSIALGFIPLHNLLRRIFDRVVIHSAKRVFDDMVELGCSLLSEITSAAPLSSYTLEEFQDLELESVDSSTLPPNYIKLFRDLLLLAFAIETMGATLYSKHGRSVNQACIAELQSVKVKNMLRSLVHQVYLPLKLESVKLSRNSEVLKSAENLSQPNYVLRVLSENTIVKDSFEDSASKRLGRLPKGKVIIAKERKVASNGSIVKYHLTEGGWINRTRNLTSSEPQVVVLDVVKKTIEEEIVPVSPEEVLTVRKASAVHLNSFHQVIKNVLFCIVPKLQLVRDEVAEQANLSKISSIEMLAITSKVFQELMPACFTTSPIKGTEEVSQFTSVELERDFFLTEKYPSLAAMSLHDVSLSCKVLELGYSLLFESKRSFFHRSQSADYNSLLLIHLFYDNHILERLIQVGVSLLLCALDPFEHCESFDINSYLNLPEEDDSDSKMELEQFEIKEEQEKRLIDQYRLRRDCALGSISKVIDFLKGLVTAFSSAPSIFEKSLQKLRNDRFQFNVESFKRQGFLLLVRYLPVLWTNHLLDTLSLETVQTIVDLFSATMKAAQEVKTFDFRISSSSNIDNFMDRLVNRQSRASPFPTTIRAAAFRVSEETLSTLVDMGFERTDCLAVAQALRTNDISQLIPLLLENPGFIATSRLQLESSSGGSSGREEAEERQLSSTTMTESNSSSGGLVQSSSNDPEAWYLPVVIAPGEENLKSQKQFSGLLATHLLQAAPNVYLDILQTAYVLKQNAKEEGTVDSSRGSFILSILNYMLKLFDGFSLGEETVRVLQLSWLYQRVSTTLRSFTENVDVPTEIYTGIYGLLYAILLISFGKVSNSNTLRSIGNDMIYLFIRLNPVSGKVHEVLCGMMENEFNRSDGALREVVMDCATISILLSDLLLQPLLVDQDSLRTWMKEVENIHKFNPGKAADLKLCKFSPEDVFSDEMKEELNQFLSKKSYPVEKESPSSSSSSTDTELATLPLLPSRLPEGTKTSLFNLCCAVLKKLPNSTEATKSAKIVQASLQLLVHILGDDDRYRSRLLDGKVHTILNGTSVAFPGVAAIYMTFLQREIEDPDHLQQVMRLSLRYSYDKIAKLGKPVSLQALLEMTVPLLYRNQQMYLQILTTDYQVRIESEQLVLSLKGAIVTSNDVTKGNESILSEPMSDVAEEMDVDETSRSTKRSRISEKDSLNTRLVKEIPSLTRKRGSDQVKVKGDTSSQIVVSDFLEELSKKLGSEDLSHDSTSSSSSPLPSPASGLTVSEMLLILGDLVGAIPMAAMTTVKFGTGNNGSGGESFIHSLFFKALRKSLGKESRETNPILHAIGYLTGSLLSRPGEGRSLVLEKMKSGLEEVIAAIEAKDCNTSFVQNLLNLLKLLLVPPDTWHQRQVFQLPMKDIYSIFNDHKLFEGVVKGFNLAIDYNQTAVLAPLGFILDCMLRKLPSPETPSSSQKLPGVVTLPHEAEQMDSSSLTIENGPNAPSDHNLVVTAANVDQSAFDMSLGESDSENEEDDELVAQSEDEILSLREEEEAEEEMDEEELEEEEEEGIVVQVHDEDNAEHLSDSQSSHEMVSEQDEEEEDSDDDHHSHHHHGDDEIVHEDGDEVEHDDDTVASNADGDNMDDHHANHGQITVEMGMQEEGSDEGDEDQQEEADDDEEGEEMNDGENELGMDRYQEYIHDEPQGIESEESSHDSNPDDVNQNLYLAPSRGLRRLLHQSQRSRAAGSRHAMLSAGPVIHLNIEDHPGFIVNDGTDVAARILQAIDSSPFVAPASRESVEPDTIFHLPFGVSSIELGGGRSSPTASRQFNISISRPSSHPDGTSVGSPPIHPLLSLLESRSNRHSLPSYHSFVSSTRSDPHYVLGGGSQIRSGRFAPTTAKKATVPLLSERRWGADISPIEDVYARFPTLMKEVDRSLRHSLGIDSSPATEITSAFKDQSFSATSLMQLMASSLFGLNRGREDVEESKEERELQESKEDFEVNNSPLSMVVEPLPEPVPVTISSASSNQNNDEVSPAVVPPPAPSAPAITTENENQHTASPDSASILMTSGPPPQPEPELEGEINQENVDFLESLPPDLRQEVLLAAEEPFLQSLPSYIREEARLLQEQRDLEMQIFASVSSASAVAATTATTTTEVTPLPVTLPPSSTATIGDQPEPGNIDNSSNSTRMEVTETVTSREVSTSQSLPPYQSIVSAILREVQQSASKTPSLQTDPALWISIGTSTRKHPPFNQRFLVSLLKWFLTCNSSTVPTELQRLVIDVSSYEEVFSRFLQALFQIVIHGSSNISDLLSPQASELDSRDDSMISSSLVETTTTTSYVLTTRFLSLLQHLLKKTDNRLWFYLMSNTGLFSSLLSYANRVTMDFDIHMELILRVLEKICSTFSKLTPQQVSTLVSHRAESVSLEETPPVDAKESDKKVKKLIPFPILTEEDVRSLCNIPFTADCTSIAKKSLIRVMRSLSLYEDNWRLFLGQLVAMASEAIAKTQTQILRLSESLQESIQLEESLDQVLRKLDHNHSSNSNNNGYSNSNGQKVQWESRLLTILRLMTVLRSRSGPNFSKESEVISAAMKNIHAGNLWELLSECLDIIREIEGQTADHESRGNDRLSAGAVNAEVSSFPRSTSALTIRFIPLIECFLTFYSKTALLKPATTNTAAAGDHSNSNSLSEAPELTRSNSLLPGSRFRQNVSYLQMQLEVQSESCAATLYKFVEKNSQLLNTVLRQNISLLDSSFSPLISVPRCRAQLHFDVKRSYFVGKLKRLRLSASRTHGSLRIAVRRSHIFEESFQSLRHKTAEEMRRRLNVTFLQEEGVDASGLTREWYTVLAREIFNPNYALFSSTGDGVTFQPNAYSYINPDHLSYFKFIGRVIGKAICDGFLLDAHFTRSFYKHILGLPVTVNDLEPIEPDYYKSLIQILETPLDLLGLELTFSAESNEFGRLSVVDLIPNGRNIPVTDDNKGEYVRIVAHHRMTSAIKKQIDSFLEGFHDLVPAELISIFDANELELLISGLPEIDIDDLRANTEYHGYQPTDPIINQFWALLKSLSKEDKAQFIQFVTGSSKVPLEGFKALQGADGIKRFNIHRAFGNDNSLPTAHTCFNQLDLPEYSTDEILREKLMYAVKEGSEGFGFA